VSSTKTDAIDIASGIVMAAVALSYIVAWADCNDPCAHHVKATVHGQAPDGTPAEITSSWCGEYKPGKGPKP